MWGCRSAASVFLHEISSTELTLVFFVFDSNSHFGHFNREADALDPFWKNDQTFIAICEIHKKKSDNRSLKKEKQRSGGGGGGQQWEASESSIEILKHLTSFCLQFWFSQKYSSISISKSSSLSLKGCSNSSFFLVSAENWGTPLTCDSFQRRKN